MESVGTEGLSLLSFSSSRLSLVLRIFSEEHPQNVWDILLYLMGSANMLQHRGYITGLRPGDLGSNHYSVMKVTG